MSFSQGLKWSGRGTLNVRQRSANGRCDVRQYSLNSRTRHLPLLHQQIAQNTSSRPYLHQQSRNLSLFGWAASKPSSDEFAQVHTSPQSVPPTQNVNDVSSSALAPSSTPAASPSPLIEAPRSVRASHATSDAPDPSILTAKPISEVEPAVLTSIEDSIALPKGLDTASLPPDLEFAAIPEGLGYLKDVCGLDYGWGSTALMEWVLEHIHITAGLSWSASIVVLALASRLAVARWAIKASDQGVKMKEIQPIINPLRERYKEAIAVNDRQKAMTIANEIRTVTKESGVNTLAMFMPMLTQIPLSFGGFRLLRGAATLPVPAFETETWLWHTNLCLADPWVLPAITAACTYLTMSGNMNSGTTTMSPTITNALLYALPAVSFAFIHFQPGAVQIFFLVNGVFTLAQTSLLRQARVRSGLGLAPLPIPSTHAASPDQSGGVGGMTVRRSNTTASTNNEFSLEQNDAYQSQDRSVIDKAVDAVKAKSANVATPFKDLWKSATGSTKEKLSQRKKDSALATLDKYERSRRQDLEMLRQLRNKNAAEASAQQQAAQQSAAAKAAAERAAVAARTEGIGGMKMTKRPAVAKRRHGL